MALLATHAVAAGLKEARIYAAALREQILHQVTGHGLDAGKGGEHLWMDATMAGARFGPPGS
ncbi:hypothetical protein [Streptomyces sp. NPDC059371]|uniref:hypothetical protein n=1 Tax=Streptomyces sp. NPDC059371 TaxID=3346812 RepID=UPI00368C223C